MAKRGRPFDPNSRKNKFHMLLSDEELKRLNYLSESTGLTKTDVFRTALEGMEAIVRKERK